MATYNEWGVPTSTRPKVTQEESSFYKQNPNAVLGTDGKWSGLAYNSANPQNNVTPSVFDRFKGWTPSQTEGMGYTVDPLTGDVGKTELTQDYLKGNVNWNPESQSFDAGNGGYNWSGMADLGLKGLGALGNIWQARTAAQGLDLAKEKFGFEKGLAAANYANQAKGYNEELARKANVGLALGGNAVSPEQRAATLATVEANKVAPTLKV